MNVAFSSILKLNSSLKEYWNPQKLLYLPAAFVAGFVIALLPAAISIVAGKAAMGDTRIEFNFSFVGFCLTFIIVSWEELWFRGLFLNYCNRHLSAVNLSVTMGLLFMFMHAMNPQIDLLKKGPALFFAGALLTALYFYYKSIWMPIGLHFGNNYTGTMLKYKLDADTLWGGDGYVSAAILCVCFLFIAARLKKTAALTEVQ